MTSRYLSPAFSPRADRELDYLAFIDDIAGGFSLFWIDAIEPILDAMGAKQLLEIGADEGHTTKAIAEYCEKHGGEFAVIEPFVKPGLARTVKESKVGTLLAQKSHQALQGTLGSFDAIFLEGDLNYYSTYHDLTDIQKLSPGRPPVVFMKNVSWPYARRDMYYDPEALPAEARHPYARSGMTPWVSELRAGLINHPFANSTKEGGPKNGVLSAAEDFVKETPGLGLFVLPVNYGFGVVYPRGSKAEEMIVTRLRPPPALARLLESLEVARLNTYLKTLTPSTSQGSIRRGPRQKIGRALRRAGRKVIGALDR